MSTSNDVQPGGLNDILPPAPQPADAAAAPAAAPVSAAPASATPSAPAAAPKFPSFSDRWRRARAGYKQNRGTYYALALFFIPSLLASQPSVWSLSWALGLVLLIIGILFNAASTYAYIAAVNGTRFGPSIKIGLRSIIPGFIVGLLTGLATLLPWFLIVPGIIMTMRLTFAPYVIVYEKWRGTRAMARSRDLIFGRTATLFFDSFGLLLILILIAIPFAIVDGIAQGLLKDLNMPAVKLAYEALGTLLVCVIAPLFVGFWREFYLDCTAFVGTDAWQPDPKRVRSYRIWAALGLLPFLATIGMSAYLFTRWATLPGMDFNVNGSMFNVNGSLNVPQDGEPGGSGNGDGATPDMSTPSGRDWQRYNDLSGIRIAMERYFKDNKEYPDALADLAPQYMTSVPKDPMSPGQEYQYRKGEQTYSVVFTLESGILTFSRGEHTMAPLGFDVVPLPTPIPEDEVTNTTTIPGSSPTPPPPAAGADADGDGLSDAEEASRGTSSAAADTDGDTLSDGYEVHVSRTNPLQADSDSDGFPDNSELQNGYEPNGPGQLSEQRNREIEAARAAFEAR